MAFSPHDVATLPRRLVEWIMCIATIDPHAASSTLTRIMVEAGCITFDDLPPVVRLEYSIDHADVYLSELAAERLLLPMCVHDADADEIGDFAAGAAAVACKGFSAAANAALLKFAQIGVAVVPVLQPSSTVVLL